MDGTPLASVLADDADARVRAVEALDVATLEARYALRGALASDADARVRAAAARALGASGDRDRASELVDALEDLAPSVREAAFAALARLGGPAGIAGAQRALADEPVWWVRRAAALALAALAGPRAVEPLCRALEDPFWRVRHAAARALAALGGRDALLRASLVERAVETTPAREGNAYVSWRIAREGATSTPPSEAGAAIDGPAESPPFFDPDPAVVTARLLETPANRLVACDLAPLLAESHEPLRAIAARRLAETGDLDALASALAWLDDARVPNAADGVGRALEEMAPATVNDLAARVLADGGAPGAEAWALGAARFDDATKAAAHRALRHSDGHVRRAALIALASEAAWVDALDDIDEVTRALAVAALAGSRAGEVTLALGRVSI